MMMDVLFLGQYCNICSTIIYNWLQGFDFLTMLRGGLVYNEIPGVEFGVVTWV